MESHLLKSASLQNLILDEVQNKKIVSVNVSHALFCLLFKHDDLVMQWLRTARSKGYTRIGASLPENGEPPTERLYFLKKLGDG